MFVVCDVCNVQLTSVEEYDGHMRGKRHNHQVQYHRNRKEQAAKCVYVRGFPPRTSVEELTAYFGTFGPVAKCVFDEKNKNAPQYAIVEFEFSQAADICLSYAYPHYVNSCKVLVKPKIYKQVSEEPYFPWQKAQDQNPFSLSKSLKKDQASGYQANEQIAQAPPTNTEFTSDCTFGTNTQYFDPREQELPGPEDSQNQLAQNTQKIYKKIEKDNNIQPKLIREDYLSLPISIEGFQKKVKDSKIIGVQNELCTLVELIQVSAEELQSRFSICKMLEDVLSIFLPGVEIFQFGSSVNGFGMRGCDMDVFVDVLKLGSSMSLRSKPVQLPYVRDLKNLKKTQGPLTKEDMVRLSQRDKCKLISRILTEYASTAVKEILVIPSKRIPIVRFTHVQSGIKCDLSVNNRLALQNTRLIQTYSLYDPRLRPLIYGLRYWAKAKDLAGNPAIGTKLSNYALTMMIIYYLQNCTPPVVPTVAKLSELCGKDKTFIEKWDCSFVSAQFVPPSTNCQTVEELLAGFFTFFSQFDFKTYGISVRTGDKLLLRDLNSHFKLQASPLTVQDPFVLDHNITQNVHEKRLIQIVQEFTVAAKKCEKWKEAVSEKSFMELLADDIPEDVNLEEVKETVKTVKNKNKKKKESVIEDLVLGEYQFAIEMKTDSLHPDLLSWLSEQEDCQGAWLQHTCAFLYLLWEQVLMFDCEIINTNMPYMPQKTREYIFRRRPAVKRSHSDSNEEFVNKKMNSGTSQDPTLEASEESPQDVHCKQKDGGNSSGVVDMEICQEGDQEISKAQKQEYDTSDFMKAEIFMDIEMKVFCKTWTERKKHAQTLKEQKGYKDGIQLERAISESLYYGKPGKLNLPIIQTQVIITSARVRNKLYLVVEFRGDHRQGMLFPVFRFVKKFTEQVAKSFLHELY